MSTVIPFSKWQGLGNDFILIDAKVSVDPSRWSELAMALCDRRFGIGADGLCLLSASSSADIKMNIINSDGTEAEMCGNLVRCIAGHLLQTGFAEESLSIETLIGNLPVSVIRGDDKRLLSATVDMGEPILRADLVPVTGLGDKETVVHEPLLIKGVSFHVTAVSMGNPHAVIFVDDLDAVPFEELGPEIETSAYFPKKTNVEFVQILSADKARVRVWERGAGPTMACGTGACAVLVAGVVNDCLNREAEIMLPGGSLHISWNSKDNHLFMTGPATHVFSGQVSI